MNICVNITYFQNENTSNKHLKQVIEALQSFNENVSIFIHTNINYDTCYNNVFSIVHDIKNIHPYFLTWKHRHFLLTHTKQYDVYLYLEDDILFQEYNLQYWCEYNSILKPNQNTVGFIRIETDAQNEEYVIDVPCHNVKYKKNIQFAQHIQAINQHTFLKQRYSYCALWLLDNQSFNTFKNSEYFTIFNNNTNIINTLDDAMCNKHYKFIRECAAHGDKHIFSKPCLLPLKQGVVDVRSKVYHLSKKYTNKETLHKPVPTYSSFYVQ